MIIIQWYNIIMVQLINQNYEYNKKLYNKVETELRKLFNKSTPINHVGSTAIPNIVGKNIIDVLVGATDKEQFDKYAIILSNNGFFPSYNSKTDIYQFFASKQEETGSGDIHIHLVVIDTERYNEFLILKQYLLQNSHEAQAYSNHKQLILQQNLDRKTYRSVKSEYVSALIARAKEYISKQ